MKAIYDLYLELINKYGSQGWWPLINIDGVNPTKTGSLKGYHPGDYSYPKDINQTFEICIGAILTQNTNWPSVEKALINLKNINALTPNNILNEDETGIKQAIKPSGYFNQKYKKLIEFSRFFIELKGRTPNRDELLNIWGIGPETADSILLYAYRIPTFVIDTYTKRLLKSMDIIDGSEDYYYLKKIFESELSDVIKNKDELVIIYQEFHALIVEHSKHMKNKKLI